MKTFIIPIILALMLCITTVSAQTYHLLQTVTGTGGGGSSTSAGYSMFSTTGQPAIGSGSSSSYSSEGGMWGQFNGLSNFYSSSYAVASGWNLVSVGTSVGNYCKPVLFPTALSRAFAYNGGYVIRDTLRCGEGFWLKFSADQSVDVPGICTTLDTIPVVAGWNIIGSLGSSVPVGAVIQMPLGIVSSNYFGYNGAYQLAATIDPGKGYWVRCRAPGKLVLTASAALAAPIAAKEESGGSAELNALTVTPQTAGAKHPSQTLMFASSVPAGNTLDSYIMPPAAPGGLDVRFKTNRYAEFFIGAEKALKEIPISIHSEGAPVTLSWTMKERVGQAYVLIEKQGEKVVAQHKLATDGTITLKDVEKKTFTLKMNKMPIAYALAQNYPNPFNPVTTLNYSLPTESHVTLTICNIVGQMVAVLQDGVQRAGFRSVRWNASDFASGVYFYRFKATSSSDPSKTFTQVKKMILMK